MMEVRMEIRCLVVDVPLNGDRSYALTYAKESKIITQRFACPHHKTPTT